MSCPLRCLSGPRWLESGMLATLADHNLDTHIGHAVSSDDGSSLVGAAVRQAVGSTAARSLEALVTRHPTARLHILAGSDESWMPWYLRRGIEMILDGELLIRKMCNNGIRWGRM